MVSYVLDAFDKKLLKKAKKIALQGLSIDPNFPEMIVNLGVICRNLGEINEAKQYLLKSISINKNLFNTYANLSTFYDFSDPTPTWSSGEGEE